MMTLKQGDVHAMEDPEARLETSLIEEFLRTRGLDSTAVQTLPKDERHRVLTEASTYAAAKLAEIESRAHFVREIHRQE